MSRPDDLSVNDKLVIPAAELSWQFGPSGGPGGQHANTANTAATLTFDIRDSVVLNQRQRSILERAFGPQVSVTASDERSQHRNRQLAMDRLGARIRRELRPKKRRRKTRPTRGSVERRIAEKKRRGQRKAERRGDW